jgi:uncharacterized membrane protein YhfC
MSENAYVQGTSFVWLTMGAAVFILLPIIAAIIWKIRKKERFSTILVGAAIFLLFALIIEKPIQNVLAFPSAMGLSEHAVSRFLNENPVLLALTAGLFPGIFEETGRFFAFKTILKKRRNRETSISYGIGHGGFEVVLILGITYIQYIAYAVMINSGTFGAVTDMALSQAPEQAENIEAIVNMLVSFSFAEFADDFAVRIFAVLFHIGASILVFYASNDKKRFFLYPLAIILHTAFDFIFALNIFGVISIPSPALECLAAVFGLSVFLCAYILLYKKDIRKVS